MKFKTSSHDIGTDIDIPSGVMSPSLTIIKDERDHPIAVLSYIELSDEERRDIQLAQLRGQHGPVGT